MNTSNLSLVQWWKLEESYETEKQLRLEAEMRHNVLGVLLNETTDHSLPPPTRMVKDEGVR